MVDILLTYDRAQKFSYGRIYLDLAEKLSQEGFDIAVLDIADLVSSLHHGFVPAEYIRQVVADADLKVIISDHAGLYYTIEEALITLESDFLCKDITDEIEDTINALYPHLQSNSPLYAPGALEIKTGFIERMREEQLPIPATVLREEVEDWTFRTIRERLQCSSEEIVLKENAIHYGKGVHLVSSEQEFDEVDAVLAQRRVRLPTPFSLTLRVMTFGPNIIGSFFVYNLVDPLRSNHLGRQSVMLNTPLQVNTSIPKELQPYLSLLGVDESLELNGTIKRDVLRIAQIRSRSLLRGIDITFDCDGNHYFLEAQTGPGSPRRGTYCSIQGVPKGPIEHNVDVATQFLTTQMRDYLANQN